MVSGLFCPKTTTAYHATTHTLITQQAVALYNELYPDAPISDERLTFLVDGARREDDPLRWLNHFYDPIHNTGLSHNGAIDPLFQFGEWESSKKWSRDEQNQSRIAYSPLIATLLSSLQKKQVERFFPTSIFTWDRAIKYWVDGDVEMAMITLGHILHLTQDASVPDHTRNDPHVSGSPYEDFVAQSSVIESSKGAYRSLKGSYKTYPSLDDAFDDIATYSNQNFYSKDTIGIQSGYNLPDISHVERSGAGSYAYSNSGNILAFRKANKNSVVFDSSYNLTIEDSKILNSYWSLLSPRAIINSAGVIDLFFKEARAAQQNTASEKSKSFFARIVDSARGLISGIFQSGDNSDVIVIPLPHNSPSPSTKHSPTPFKTPLPSVTPTLSVSPIPTTPILFPLNGRVSRVIDGDTIVLDGDIVVRYLGIDAPEISDTSTKGGCLAQESKSRNIALVDGKMVSLEYSGEKTDSFGRLLAYVSTGGILVNQQLIREGFGYAYNFNHPHPKEGAFSSAQESARKEKIGIWGSRCTLTPSPSATPKQSAIPHITTPTCSPTTSATPSRNTLIINEVAWMGTSESANNEWIEVKNIGSTSVSLSGWSLITEDGGLKIELSQSKKASLSPGGLLLLERTNDSTVPTVIADVIYNGSIANTHERLMLFDSNCILMDDVSAGLSWPAGDNSSKRTMERDPSGFGWHTSQATGGTPGSNNSTASSGGGGQPAPSTSPSPSFTPPPVADIRINEIMYNPPGSDSAREWIEIYNNGAQSFDVTLLRLLENQVSHKINPLGDVLLSPSGYAVIADDPTTFLNDHPGFSAQLFDSSFSLRNDGESIALTLNDQIISSVSYETLWGGNGDGTSLQYMESGWQSFTPTPGYRNGETQQELPQASPATHLLISEIQVAGNHPNDEFIELYNPTGTFISLKDYSIQYISGRAETFSDSYKKNLPDEDVVAPYGFYLLANTDGIFAPKADMTWGSFSLSGDSTGGIIVLVSSTTPITSLASQMTVDWVSYGKTALAPYSQTIPDPLTSIERNALVNTVCKPAQGEHLFSGNGCETNTLYDFLINTNPFPQGKSHLAEPRSGPTQPSSFVASYNPDSLVLSLSWQPTPSAAYYGIEKIRASDLDSELFEPFDSTTNAYSDARMTTIGEEYVFAVRSYDADGFSSTQACTTIFFPSPFEHLYFYETGPGSGSYILEPVFKTYPFITDPNSHQPVPHWRGLAFFLNQPDMPIEPSLPYGGIEQINGGMRVSHPMCVNPYGSVTTHGLTFPDTEGMCGFGGGIFNSTYPYEFLEDKRVRLPIDHETGSLITPTSTVTAAFFASGGSTNGDGRYPQFFLIAVDKHQTPIGPPPSPQPPTSPIITTTIDNLDAIRERLVLTWDNSTDPDSLDRFIAYEFRGGIEGAVNDLPWESATRSFDGNVPIEPSIPVIRGNSYTLEIRAVDNDGARSQITSVTVLIPPAQALMTIPLAQLVFEEDTPKDPTLTESTTPKAILPEDIEVSITSTTTEL